MDLVFISVDDSHVKIPQIGKVVVGNDVEIGANSTIDRGTVADTIVHDLCKFDNGVQIGHNVTVGKRMSIDCSCYNCWQYKNW